jgi:hypothetical protein
MTIYPLPKHVAVPKKNTLLERAVGRFILNWGVLEKELDTAFPVLFRLDETLALCLTANLGTKAKLDSISSAASMLAGVLGDITDDIHDVVAATRTLSETRNILAHGQPREFGDPGPSEERRFEWVKTTARKQLKGIVHPHTPATWFDDAKAAIRLARKLRALMRSAQSLLGALTEGQIDSVCLMQLEWTSPGPQDLTFRQLPPSDSSSVSRSKFRPSE